MVTRRGPGSALAHALEGDGPGYARLVPASLLPPEDPAAGRRRTVRDWVVDVLLFLTAAGLAVVFWATNNQPPHPAGSTSWQWLDALLGALACLSLWARRRLPAATGLLTAALSTVSAAAAAASVVTMFSVSVHRRSSIALAVAAVNIACGEAFALLRPSTQFSFVESTIVNIGFAGVFVAWGMFVRSRRQLVWTLRERAERAEAERELQAEQARRDERTRIAREMHDVLAHRISMIALHAGGLQVRPDLPAAEVHATAELLRSTAHQALDELRGVIGVLRTDGGDAHGVPPPQPTLADIPRLVAETRQAGARIDFAMQVDGTLPDGTGRDAYRIVQEALTNVAKHARGTATVVRVSGRAGDGLHVDVRNKLPVSLTPGTLPGSGTGLVGLRERVTLAGGTLTHGPTGDGEFVVDARLAWSIEDRAGSTR